MGWSAVAFDGSPRVGGNTSILLRMVLSELEEAGARTETIRLVELGLRGCTACERCASRRDRSCVLADDGLNGCIERMVAADVVLIGSPVYTGDVSSMVRAFIERACMVSRANDNLFRRKIGAAVVAQRRAGGTSALDSIHRFLLAQEMVVAGSSYWNVAFGRGKGEVLADEEGVRTMKALGANIVWLLQKTRG